MQRFGYYTAKLPINYTTLETGSETHVLANGASIGFVRLTGPGYVGHRSIKGLLPMWVGPSRPTVEDACGDVIRHLENGENMPEPEHTPHTMEYMDELNGEILIFRYREGGTTIEVGRPQTERLDGVAPEDERQYVWDRNISVYDYETGKTTIKTYREFRERVSEWIADEREAEGL